VGTTIQRSFAALLVFCLLTSAAIAQGDGDGRDKPGVRVTVGAGVAWAPRYPGAEDNRLRAIPVIGVSSGRFFAGGDPDGGGAEGPALGVSLYRDSSWSFSLALALGLGEARRESDHPDLAGTGDIDRATRLVAAGRYRWRWLDIALRVAPDVSNKDQGTLAFLDLTARYRATDKLTFSAGPGITWADDSYMQTFFGVTPEQAANSRLPAYQAQGGVHMVRFGVGAAYRIDPQWTVGMRLATGSLAGDAERSPITRDRDQHLAAAFASYRF
jgi:outer membrane protein